MQIFIINLDRHAARWQRMAEMLKGLAFKRIAAVDGKNLDGPEPEYRGPAHATCFEDLSRYERACALSHRLAWQAFLAGQDSHCCVLEDDVFISPDFPRFMNSTDWIPADGNVVKIETSREELLISRETIACWDRQATLLRSLNYGSAAYIISRRGAQILLGLTQRADRPVDCILFDETGVKQLHPVYQLSPALCIQASHQANGIIFPELKTSIQPDVRPEIPARKSLPNKIKRELLRPFYQLNRGFQSAGRLIQHRLKGVRRCRVPFA
jgi:glycosyl transferase family 25